jgi:hypothetical protein
MSRHLKFWKILKNQKPKKSGDKPEIERFIVFHSKFKVGQKPIDKPKKPNDFHFFSQILNFI